MAYWWKILVKQMNTNKKNQFLGVLLDILLGNLLAGKGASKTDDRVIWAGKGIIIAEQDFNVASSFD